MSAVVEINAAAHVVEIEARQAVVEVAAVGMRGQAGGVSGAGLPVGGAAGASLVKASSADGDVAWGYPSPLDGGTFN